MKFEDVNGVMNKEPIKTVPQQIENSSVNYLPIETLPSNYKFYSGKKIFARPMNVSEVKLLASMDENNYNQVMNDVLKKTIRGIEVDDILVSDKYFLIFWLRANTYRNSGYELDFECASCEKMSKYNFDIDVLEIKYLDENLKIDEERVLPNSKDKVTIKFKTIRDENKVREFAKRTKGTITKYDEEILDVSSNLGTINGEELSVMKKYEYVEKMHPVDFSFVLSLIDLVSFGVKSEIKAVCNTCKETTPIGVTFRPEFFIPKYQF